MRQMKSDPPEIPEQPKSSKKHSKDLKESETVIAINQETASMRSTREDTKVKLQECQKVLLELKSGGTDLRGKALKERKTKLCQMLGVHEAKWIDEQEPIDNRYDNLLTDIAHVLGATKETSPFLQTFVNASGGLALKGILVGCSAESKEIVLSAPKKVNVTNVTKPSMQSGCLVREFTSAIDCECFLETLDILGCSVAAIPKVHSSTFQPQSQENKGEASEDCCFYAKVECCIHATAACPVDPNDLRFSSEVLSELEKVGKAIKEQTRHGKGAERIEEACAKFLKTFDSHVSTGILHMGGVKQFIGTYSGRAQPLHQVRSLVEHALNGYITMSHSGLLCSSSAKATAANLKTALDIPKLYDVFDLSDISLKTINNGGQDVANLPVWKMGLSVNKNSWALIDRSLSIEHTPMWDLVPNHEEIDMPVQVVSCLQTAWEKEIGVQRPIVIAPILYDVESLLDSWSSDPMFLENCQERLLHLLFVIEELFRETGSYSYWEHVLSPKKAFRQFLAKVEREEQFPPESERFIRYTMKRIRNAGCRTGIQSEFDHVLRNVQATMHTITDLPTLVTVLKENLIPSLEFMAHRQPEHSKGIEACITVELAVGVSHLLQSTSSPLATLLLRISLLQVQYHHKQMRFEHDITKEKLEELCSVVEGNWDRYCAVEGTFRKESFLINLLLTSSNFQMDQPRKEIEFERMIRGTRHAFSQQMRNLLETRVTSPVKWSRLVTITQQIASGNVTAHRDYGTDSTSNPNQFDDLLGELGLGQYYPNGTTWQKATAIRKFSKDLKKTDIPWKLLHGLLMIDHRTRDRVPSERKEQQKQQYNGQSSELNVDDFFSQSNSSSDAETELSPLDVLLATFLCCDGILRQKLAQKLFVCKLAIPFFYMDGYSRQPTMSLWAFRTIVLEWFDQQQKGQDAFATEHKLHIISFVRIGRPNESKSHIANCLIRDDSHITFYCSENQKKNWRRLAANGMVECSWFLPANKETDFHKDACLLLNLRGDANVWEEQVKVLMEISAVIAVVINIEDLKGEAQQSLVQICGAVKGVVILLTTSSPKPDRKVIKANWDTFMGEIEKEEDKKKIRHTILKSGFEKSLKPKVSKDVSELLQDSSGLSIDEVSATAADHNFQIDEKEDLCFNGKKLARSIVSSMEGEHSKDYKKELLPLQCDTWLRYSNLKRPLHQKPKAPQASVGEQQEGMAELRQNEAEICNNLPTVCKEFTQASVGEQQEGMAELRQKEAEICNNLPTVCKEFTQILMNSRKDTVSMYFLEWLNILLGRRAKTTLPILKAEYRKQWEAVQKAKSKDNKDVKDEKVIKALEEGLSKADHDLDDASLELTHFCRELGQIYQAIKAAAPNQIRVDPLLTQVEKAPEVFARLLLRGFPLEVVDGDASNVPMAWVQAILLKLQEFLPEKKLFIVSVLGVQSSGKSTLLNTMFGLQFAVSACRCTKGVFMQVIPVDRKDLPMDYIAVLDTEGLRSVELTHSKHNHDNELATLAIGLGDVTLINIMGQNTSDIEDILQIAVHAFLRMKMVSKNLNMHQTCIFIHQNVSSVKAKDETVQSCMKLQGKLDKMTKGAAHEEGLKDIQAFSQIIKFNALENVCFFPVLRYGDPPMAPSNPGYSDNVRSVLESLLDGAAERQTTFLTVSDFAARLRDLWSAILDDDFVFSFRNSLEIRAYNDMSKFYSLIDWELTFSVMDWLQRTADNNIKKCETDLDLEQCVSGLLRELHQTIAESRQTLEQTLIQHFDNNPLREIMIQWKETKLNSLINSAEEKITEGRKHLHEVEKAHKLEILSMSKLRIFEGDLLEKAVKLATELDGQLDGDSEIEEKFGETWNGMKSNLPVEDQNKCDMDTLIQTVLFESFPNNGPIVNEELKRKTPIIDIGRLSSPIRVEKEHLEEADPSSNRTNEEDAENLQKANLQTDKVLHDINVHLQKLTTNGDIKFQKGHAVHAIWLLKDHFKKWNEGEGTHSFAVLPNYVIRLAVYVGRYCEGVFKKMQGDYESRHGVAAKLEAIKSSAYNLFKNTVKNSAVEVIAADFLCNKLIPVVEHVQDLDNFVKIFRDKFEAATNELLHSFRRHSGNHTWAGTSPYELLFRKLWGCQEMCPFCGEPCALTSPDHQERSHHCIQHRPTGVKGYRWKKNDEFRDNSCKKDCLITNTCNYWIQCSNMTFSCKGCTVCGNEAKEYHLYKEYKKYFPRWDIAPDPTNSVSKYWMWFMATYRKDLAKMYSALPPNVPEEWSDITRENALEDLRIHKK